MRLPFQPFSAQDVPQFAVPRPSPGVRPAPPVLPNLAANPELAMTRAATSAIDNIIGAVSSYRKMIINDEREAEREQEKARIELERQSAENAADWLRKNSLRIRQYEEGLRTQQITKEEANKGLDALVKNAFPPPEAGPMSPVDKRTYERIQDAVRSDYDTFMVIGAGQEQARKEAELNIFQNEAVQDFNNQLMEQAQIRIEDPDSAVNPAELPEFYEKVVEGQKAFLAEKLRSAGYSDAVIKQQTELLETKLDKIGYTDQFQWMTQVSRLELEGKVLGVSNNLLAELQRFEYENIRDNSDITPSQGVVLFERKIEELYKRPDFLSLPSVEQNRIISRNKVVFEQRRTKLQQDLTSEYQETIQGANASSLSEVLSPPDGTVYESVDQIKAAKDAIDELHSSLYETGAYPNEQTFIKAVHDSYLQLERNTAQRMLNQGMHKRLAEELDDYNEGMFPTLDEKERGAFKRSAEAGISTGNTRSATVAKQTIKDHLDKAVATGTPINMGFIDDQVKAGNIPEDLALGYMAEAEYIQFARDFISEAGGLEEMSNLQLENFLQEYEPYRWKESRKESTGEDTIYTERLVNRYKAFAARIDKIRKDRKDNMAADAHKRSQELGYSQGVFDSRALPYVFARQQRIAPGSDFEFIPKEVVTEFDELWKQGGQQGQFFDGVPLRGNLAIDRGLMAARINQVKGDNYSALEEMARRTGLDPVVLDLYAKFTNAGEVHRLERLNTAANLENVAALKREIGGTEENVNVDLKDVFSDTSEPEGEDYQKLLGLYAGNPQAQANLRSLAEKYVLIQKQNGASYEQALGTFVDDMQFTIDGQIVNAAGNGDVQMSMILPNEHFKDADSNEVVDFLVGSASKIVELPRYRMNSDDLPKDQRDRLEQIIATNKALIQNGEVSYAFQNVKGGFELVVFTGGVYTPLRIGITHEEVLRGISQVSVKPKGKPPGAATSKEGAIIGAGYGEDFDKPPGKRTQPAPEESEGVGQTGVQVEGVDPGKSPINRLFQSIKEGGQGLLAPWEGESAKPEVKTIPFTIPETSESKAQSRSLSLGPHAVAKGNPEAEAVAEDLVPRLVSTKFPEDYRKRFVAVYGELEVDAKGIRPDFVMAMVLKENESMNPALVGDKDLKNHAYGLMQVRLPAYTDIKNFLKPPPEYTWEEVQDPNNWRIQLQAGIDYLAVLRDHYGMTDYSDLAMAYNAGPEFKERSPQAQAEAKAYWKEVEANFDKVDKFFGLKWP